MSGGRSHVQQKVSFHTTYPENWSGPLAVPDNVWQLNLSVHLESENLRRAFDCLKEIFSKSILPFKFYLSDDEVPSIDGIQANKRKDLRGTECQIFIAYDEYGRLGAVRVEYLKHLMLIILKKLQKENVKIGYFTPVDHRELRLGEGLASPFSYPINQDAPLNKITFEPKDFHDYKIDINGLKHFHVNRLQYMQEHQSKTLLDIKEILSFTAQQEVGLYAMMSDIMNVFTATTDASSMRKSLCDLRQEKSDLLEVVLSIFPCDTASDELRDGEKHAEINQLISFWKDLKENTDLIEIKGFQDKFAELHLYWQQRCKEIGQLFKNKPNILSLCHFDVDEMIKKNPAVAEVLYYKLLHATYQDEAIERETSRAKQENCQTALVAMAVSTNQLKKSNGFEERRKAQDYACFLANIFCTAEDFVYYNDKCGEQYRNAQLKVGEVVHLIMAMSGFKFEDAGYFYDRACAEWAKSPGNLKRVIALREESAKQILRKIKSESEAKKTILTKEITDILAFIAQGAKKYHTNTAILEYLIDAISTLKKPVKNGFFSRGMQPEAISFCASITSICSCFKLDALDRFISISSREIETCFAQSVEQKDSYVERIRGLLSEEKGLYFREKRLCQLLKILSDYYAQNGNDIKNRNSVTYDIAKILSKNLETMTKSNIEFYLQHPDYPALRHFVVEHHLLRTVRMADSGCDKSMCIMGEAYLRGKMKIHGCVVQPPRKVDEGISWLKKAADRNNADAAYLLASFWANILPGVNNQSPDLKSAIKYIKIAVKLKDPENADIAYLFASFHADTLPELKNTSPDAGSAIKYLEIAAKLKHPFAQKLLNINEDFKWGSVLITPPWQHKPGL